MTSFVCLAVSCTALLLQRWLPRSKSSTHEIFDSRTTLWNTSAAAAWVFQNQTFHNPSEQILMSGNDGTCVCWPSGWIVQCAIKTWSNQIWIIVRSVAAPAGLVVIAILPNEGHMSPSLQLNCIIKTLMDICPALSSLTPLHNFAKCVHSITNWVVAELKLFSHPASGMYAVLCAGRKHLKQLAPCADSWTRGNRYNGNKFHSWDGWDQNHGAGRELSSHVVWEHEPFLTRAP